MTDRHVPFNLPYLAGRELEYMAECAHSSRISGDGPFTAKATAALSSVLGGARCFLTTSCTHALELAALMLRVGPDDEVILPAFTFVSTANAVALFGAKPVFVDIDPDTLNLDPAKVEAAITPRTKAIFLVHYAGVACDMDAFLALSERTGIPLVEDAAHAIGATWRGRPLGTLGRFATFSFHETKNIACGEGGALVVRDEADIQRAEILREKGTNRRAFYRGDVDKYTWVDVGSSWLMADLLAAFLLGQLEEIEAINAGRVARYHRYREALADLEDAGRIVLPTVPEYAGLNGHLFHVLVRDGEVRDAVLAGMRSIDVVATFHYVPLHLSPMGRRFGYAPGDLPVTERQAARLIRFPLHNGMSDVDQERAIEVFRHVLDRVDPGP